MLYLNPPTHTQISVQSVFNVIASPNLYDVPDLWAQWWMDKILSKKNYKAKSQNILEVKCSVVNVYVNEKWPANPSKSLTSDFPTMVLQKFLKNQNTLWWFQDYTTQVINEGILKRQIWQIQWVTVALFTICAMSTDIVYRCLCCVCATQKGLQIKWQDVSLVHELQNDTQKCFLIWQPPHQHHCSVPSERYNTYNIKYFFDLKTLRLMSEI